MRTRFFCPPFFCPPRIVRRVTLAQIVPCRLSQGGPLMAAVGAALIPLCKAPGVLPQPFERLDDRRALAAHRLLVEGLAQVAFREPQR